MKEPRWYDVLEPREAVVAGLVGLAIVYPLLYYAGNTGYVFWGYGPSQWKNLGTAVDLLSFAIPYFVVKRIVKRRRTTLETDQKQR